MLFPSSKTASLLQNSFIQAAILFVLLYATFFQNLTAVEPSLMEARNFITVREITQNGTWLIPTLNGEPRLAKPPLPTWLTAFSAITAGDIYNLAALRFPAAIISALLVYFLFLLSRQLTSDRLVPFLAGVIVATSFSFFNVGRQGTWDIYCHSFMLGGIWLLIKGLQANTKAFHYFIGSGILLGCSFLSKGPVSFYALLLPFGLSYGWGYGFKIFRKHGFGLLLAFFVCMIISLAWPLYVYLQEPAKMATNISNESTAWVNRHVKPFWFYLSFPWQAGIWAILAVAALIAPYAGRRVAAYGNYRFLSSWVWLTLFLLSIIPEKKERYLLPLLIPLALLTAHYVRYLVEAFRQKAATKSDYRIIVFNAILFLLIALALPGGLYWFAYQKNLISGIYFAGISVLFLIVALCFLIAIRKKHFGLFLVAAVFLHVLTLFILLPHYENMRSPVSNYRDLALVRQEKQLNLIPFYVLHSMSPEHIWKVGKKVDTLALVNQQLQLPATLPLALFSPDSLTTTMLPAAEIQMREISRYQHDRRHPERVYHVYLIAK